MTFSNLPVSILTALHLEVSYSVIFLVRRTIKIFVNVACLICKTLLLVPCVVGSHRGYDFASHLLTATSDLSRMRKKSILTFFVDVIAVFESVLHPFTVDLRLIFFIEGV